MIAIKCVVCKREIITYPSIAKTKKYCSYNCKSIAYTGRKFSLEIRNKMKENSAKYWLGKKRDKKTILKISKSNKGHTPWNKGKKLPQLAGKNHPNWKDGINKSKKRILIYCPNHPFAKKNYVPEHRLFMEKKLGRYLSSAEVVHHINHNPLDNRIKNLILFENNKKHLEYHRNISGFKSNNKFCSSKIKI